MYAVSNSFSADRYAATRAPPGPSKREAASPRTGRVDCAWTTADVLPALPWLLQPSERPTRRRGGRRRHVLRHRACRPGHRRLTLDSGPGLACAPCPTVPAPFDAAPRTCHDDPHPTHPTIAIAAPLARRRRPLSPA